MQIKFERLKINIYAHITEEIIRKRGGGGKRSAGFYVFDKKNFTKLKSL